jgi:hypothetical protein
MRHAVTPGILSPQALTAQHGGEQGVVGVLRRLRL